MRRRVEHHDGQDGAISVMAAVMVLTTLLATSLAVDVGRVAYVSRDQQGVTDRASMDAVRALDDSTALTLEGLYLDSAQVIGEALGRNPGSTNTARDREVDGIVLGTVVDEAFVAICGTEPDWVAASSLPTCTDADYAGTHTVDDVSAIEVFTDSVVPFVFAIGAPADPDSGIVGRAVHKRARAGTGNPVGAVTAASTAVDLGDGLVTEFLSGLLGADVSLSLVGWNGLLQTGITLGDLAAQVGAGTPTELLDTTLTLDELVDAMANVLQADSDTSANVSATLAEMVAATLGVGLVPVPLGELITIDPTAAGSAMDATLSAGDLLTAFAQLANYTSAATVTLTVPSFTTVTVTVVEPPQRDVGRPGKDANDDWITEATTAQVRVDVELPLGTIVSGTADGSEDDDLILPEVQAFRTRIDEITGCWEAMGEAGTGDGSIRSDLEAAIQAAEDKANELGLLGATTQALIDTTFGLLGGVLDGLGCVLTPGYTRDSIKSDLYDALANYEQVLRDLSGTGAAAEDPGDPVLSLRLAEGRNALASITCSDPVQADTMVNGDFGRIVLTSTGALASDPSSPAAVYASLLDVDLGVLGTVEVGMTADHALGQIPDPGEALTFTAPWPAPAQEVRGNRTGLDALLDGVDLVTTVEVLGVLDMGPMIDELLAQAQALLSPILADVNTEVLEPLLETLGLDLGVIEAAVTSATCEGPPRLLPNP